MIKPPPPDHVGDPVQSPSAVNLPNALTLLRLLLVPVFVWLLLREGGDDPTSRFWAAAVFLVASLTDLVDGELARRMNLVTSFGKVADPIAVQAPEPQVGVRIDDQTAVKGEVLLAHGTQSPALVASTYPYADRIPAWAYSRFWDREYFALTWGAPLE